YDTDKKDFAGYTFVGMTEDSAAADGNVVADKTLHVIYAYDKNSEPIVKKGSVDVKYVDRATGEVLPFADAALTTVKDNAPAGEKYDTDKKDFAGYTF
ncbi:MucBP domain-containing protein, partial [Ligilactobacillus agilis]|uniref:MucBP domain-containing protein n=1 Tax=Ligilactobacillus agilis TaxID=1601 RepID=UPI00195BE0CF